MNPDGSITPPIPQKELDRFYARENLMSIKAERSIDQYRKGVLHLSGLIDILREINLTTSYE